MACWGPQCVCQDVRAHPGRNRLRHGLNGPGLPLQEPHPGSQPQCSDGPSDVGSASWTAREVPAPADLRTTSGLHKGPLRPFPFPLVTRTPHLGLGPRGLPSTAAPIFCATARQIGVTAWPRHPQKQGQHRATTHSRQPRSLDSVWIQLTARCRIYSGWHRQYHILHAVATPFSSPVLSWELAARS